MKNEKIKVGSIVQWVPPSNTGASVVDIGVVLAVRKRDWERMHDCDDGMCYEVYWFVEKEKYRTLTSDYMKLILP